MKGFTRALKEAIIKALVIVGVILATLIRNCVGKPTSDPNHQRTGESGIRDQNPSDEKTK
jgi:hypothetical protein